MRVLRSLISTFCGFVGLATVLRSSVRSRSSMFRISIVDTLAQRKLVVEGRLSGPWVAELRTTCSNAMRDFGRTASW